MSRCSLRFYDTIRRGNCQPGAKRLFASVREAPTLRRFVPRSLSISLGIRKAIFYQPKLSGAPAFAFFTITNVDASGGHPAATFLIKRKWPKRVLALGFHSSITPVAPEVRASLSLPRESDKERPGSPPGPRAGRQPSSGGCRPGLPLDSRPNPGLHWPPGRIGAPCAAGPGRGASAQPARCSRRNLGFRYPPG